MKQEKTRKPTVEEQPKTLEVRPNTFRLFSNSCLLYFEFQTENPVKRKKTDSETPDLATGKAKVQKKAEASAKKLIKKKKLKRKSKVIVDKSLE